MELKKTIKRIADRPPPPPKKKLHIKHFCGQYYETKAAAGLSSTSMVKGGKEREKLFL
jgi:hypothetical protein